jgi:hypothetical protein
LRCSALVATLVGAVHRTAMAIEVNRRYLISKELSALSLGADSLASTYRFSETNPLRTAAATTSEF